jgi:hypothetical protein
MTACVTSRRAELFKGVAEQRALAHKEGQSIEPAAGTVVVESAPLTIPDEIAPAVIPYMACLTAAKGSPLRNGLDGPEALRGQYKVGQNCTEVRAEASRNADRMLKGKRSKRERADLINSTLVSIDTFVGSLPSLAQ